MFHFHLADVALAVQILPDLARSCQACGAKRPDPLHRARRQLERKVRHTAMLRGFQHPNRLKYF